MANIYNMAEEEGVKEQYPVGTSVNYLGGDENKKKYAKMVQYVGY